MSQKFMGLDVVQTWEDFGIWEYFFDHYQVGTIIELGTGHGGLALFFALQAYQRGIQYHTYDNILSFDLGSGLPSVLGMANNFHCADIWDSAGEIIDIIGTAPRPIVMLFDNGDKPREWNTFAPHLSKGDFCAVHDWGIEFGPEHIGGVGVQPIMEDLCALRPQHKNNWYTMWFQRI
jgi:cephalosporin hydroxylase